MNAINKAGRPIIPSRSSDEEFFIGSRAREKESGTGATTEAKESRRVAGGWEWGGGEDEETRKPSPAKEREDVWRAFGQFVIKFKIPSAEEADERVTNGRDRNGSSTGLVTWRRINGGWYPAPMLFREVARASLTLYLHSSYVAPSSSLPRRSLLPRRPLSNAEFPWGAVGAEMVEAV